MTHIKESMAEPWVPQVAKAVSNVLRPTPQNLWEYASAAVRAEIDAVGVGARWELVIPNFPQYNGIYTSVTKHMKGVNNANIVITALRNDNYDIHWMPSGPSFNPPGSVSFPGRGGKHLGRTYFNGAVFADAIHIKRLPPALEDSDDEKGPKRQRTGTMHAKQKVTRARGKYIELPLALGPGVKRKTKG